MAELVVHDGRLWAGGGFTATGDGTLVSFGVGNHPLPDFVSVEDADGPSDERERASFESGDVSVRVWPNPVRASDVNLEVVSKTSHVLTVSVYDMLGRRVADLYSGPVTAGEIMPLSLPDAVAASMAPGLYAVRAGAEATAFVSIVR